MNATVKLPKLGETADSVIVETWYVGQGDYVEVGSPLLAAETDKVTVEVPSPVAGTVIEVLVPEGNEVATGAPICRIATV